MDLEDHSWWGSIQKPWSWWGWRPSGCGSLFSLVFAKVEFPGMCSISTTHGCCDMVVGVFSPEWTHWMGWCPKLLVQVEIWLRGGALKFCYLKYPKFLQAVSPWQHGRFWSFWSKWTWKIIFGGDPSRNHGHGAKNARAAADPSGASYLPKWSFQERAVSPRPMGVVTWLLVFSHQNGPTGWDGAQNCWFKWSCGSVVAR